ncbi:MAG: hypothetical protein JXB30_17110 [Anaerolineae bacterium]|nr:hypothetical protein [Anaerolineae bacterium]
MQATHKTSIWSEIRTLFWLQWKLTIAMFRSTRLSVRLRLVGCLLQLLTIGVTIPLFTLMGVGVAVGLALLSPRAAYEVATLINTFMLFVWLLLPASQNSQMLERFEMSRLFPFPISTRGIIVGSTLMSMLNMTGIWTAPIILGEVAGLAWHNPIALPVIVLGALPAFALLILSGRIMEDLFDLVAGDRRLRALMLVILTLPFMFCWVGQYAIQEFTDNFSEAPPIIADAFGEDMRLAFEKLDEADSFPEARQSMSGIIEILRPSRLLIWLPPGWSTAGMGLAATGDWGLAFPFLLLSIGFAALLLRVHAGVTWRLMNGAAMSMGIERVRSRQRFINLPGPPALWALFRKDWIYLRRSPLPRQLLFPILIMAIMLFFFTRSFTRSNEVTAELLAVAPMLMGTGVITVIGMTSNIAFTANYYGVVDRKGFAIMATSPIDRRYIILSANLVILLYTSLQFLIISLGVAIATGAWYMLPLGLYLGLCLQISGLPAYNLAAIIGPYRAQFQFGANQRQGNLWGMLAWLISAPPVLALVILPYFLWKPGLVITLPLGIVYSVGLYWITLKPLASLLQRRERPILDAVAAEE